MAVCNVTQRLSFTPNWSLVVQLEYQHPISDRMNGFIRGLFTLYPGNENFPTNRFDTIDSYATSNLYLGLRDAEDAWEVSLFAKNLFNTGRTLSRCDLPFITNGTSGTYGSYVPVSYTPPREFGISLRYASARADSFELGASLQDIHLLSRQLQAGALPGKLGAVWKKYNIGVAMVRLDWHKPQSAQRAIPGRNS